MKIMEDKKIPLYCSEQIQIPHKLPEIMKEFCKAAIKTQPHDILKWSAAYFRSLANDQPPIMKTCLEREIRNKYLTRGCLRMLIEHIGKGFFVQKRVLQAVWEMILPLDEFYKLLSLAGMLHWKELHWLKLVGIMAGWLSTNLKNTMILVCDLLTNDLEGGMARIPIWMFLTVYNYLAELDCSKEQRILNGRKVKDNGSLEELIEPNELPYIISSISLKRYLNELCNVRKSKEDEDDKIESKSISTESSIPQTISNDQNENLCKKDFKILDDVENLEQFFKKYPNFDVLMFYFKTHEIRRTKEIEEGPYHISSSTMQNAQENERKVAELRERHIMNSSSSSTDVEYISGLQTQAQHRKLHPTKSSVIVKDSIYTLYCNEKYKEDSVEKKHQPKTTAELEIIINDFKTILHESSSAGDVTTSEIGPYLDSYNYNECKENSDDEIDLDPDWVNKETISELSNELELTAYNYGVGDYQGSYADQQKCNENDMAQDENKTVQISPLIEQKSDIISPLSARTYTKETSANYDNTIPSTIPISQEGFISQKPPESSSKNIENVFNDDIPINYKLKKQKVDKDMILGLISDSNIPFSSHLKEEEEEINSDLSEPPKCIDKTGYHSDDSSIFPQQNDEIDSNIKFKEFQKNSHLSPSISEEIVHDYIIQELPGIGGKSFRKQQPHQSS
ncbi:uncharacterized protein LOC129606958 [Condylostylus longicornis]|uniref:uncharacterized protein LOC129606958 n=1 Tax=Condylostylus longicornis TaxID=2530218 RepID=UPI00244E03F4|nr:uncharacterized protein LOC129606958 [Condylostylus longicornis]